MLTHKKVDTLAVTKDLTIGKNASFKMDDGANLSLPAATLAAAGTTASDATPIVKLVSVVTGANGSAGVALPAAGDLAQYMVINDSPQYALKVYPESGGNDNINELAEDQAFIVGPGQECTFKSINATQWYANKDASRPRTSTHFEIFDDFTDAAIDTTNNWIVFAGTDGDATAAAVVTAPEGQIVMGSGDGGSTEDGSVLSLILLAKGALVSLGPIVFECRAAFDQLTGVSACFGLSDTLATTAEHLLHTVDSGTVADGGLSVTNTAEFVFSSDATATTAWQYVSENAGTIGNAGAEEASSSGPTADTYDTLRIEIDENGTARYYLNGVLETTRTSAVATTALLIPYIGIDAGTDAQTVTDLSIDYIYFAGARPSSNA